MPIRKRIIRTRDQLPTDADRVANVSKAAPPTPAPPPHPMPPLSARSEALRGLGVGMQRLGRADYPGNQRNIPVPRSGGFRVSSIEERRGGVVHISAMGPDGIVANFDMDATAYELLRDSGSLDIGAALNLTTQADVLEQHVIGRSTPLAAYGRIEHSVGFANGDTFTVTPFTFNVTD